MSQHSNRRTSNRIKQNRGAWIIWIYISEIISKAAKVLIMLSTNKYDNEENGFNLESSKIRERKLVLHS